MTTTRLRGEILSFSAEPVSESDPGIVHFEDGVVSIQDGHITAVQDSSQAESSGVQLSDCTDLRGSVILPGFIDTHIHYPQMDIIGGYGEHLLEWLDKYAFPAEIAYADKPYADAQAELFMHTLFRHGTTTALTFTTVHEHTSDSLFKAAERVGARMIAGKVLMNRNAPTALSDKSFSKKGDGIEESAGLIQRWHNKGRLAYAVTPRFAITCTDSQLSGAADLLQQYPEVYLHTHLAEDPGEITATMALYPKAKDYVDVYDQFKLLGPRSLFAHGIHLSDSELKRLAESGSGIAFCPTSNLFLGSGLLKRSRLQEHSVRMGVATDVGGGTSFSMLTTLGEGYKVGQLNGEPWHPYNAMHAITRGNAHALGLGDKIGQIAEGFEADLTVLRPTEGSMLDQRLQLLQKNANNELHQRLFAAFFMADSDAIERTYVAGKVAYRRSSQEN